jgi:hypothetical protein
VAASLFAFFLFPTLVSLDVLPVQWNVTRLSATATGLTIAFAAVALAVIASSLRVPLYRLLEGYSWPRSLRDRGRRRHLTRKRALKERYDRAGGQEAGLALEEYRRYPVEDDEISPTRFGNSIRSFERYAFVRYGLDSQTVWYELEAVAPSGVVQTINNSKASVDFCVCSLYLSALLGLSSILASLVASLSLSLLIVGVLFLVTVPLWYRFAVIATDDWKYCVQALVNLGRKPLAEAMGLTLPPTLEEERQMWRRLNWFVRGQLEGVQESWLNPYRAKPGKTAGLGVAGTPQTYEAKRSPDG